MATLEATGDWTKLPNVFDATRSKMIGNEPRLEGEKGSAPGGLGLNLEALKTAEGVEFPELNQFIDLVAGAYGLLHWQAALFIQYLMCAKMMTKSDTVLGDPNGYRIYP